MSQRVLVVDDDPQVRGSMIRVLLRAYGTNLECDVASDGRQAVEKMRRSRFDVVVSDVHMPEMDGLTLLSTCVAEDLCPEERFVFVSGSPGAAEPAEIMRRGIPVLWKPFVSAELVLAVGRAAGIGA